MESANIPAFSKKYISGNIKLDFSNKSNLKESIQNRISDDTETNFINVLQNMMGDDKTGNGIRFSEITLMAMAYFFDEIFIEEKKDHHYSLDMVKGFLDAKNVSPYTAIYEIDVEFFKLKEAPYFDHCWLIIQTAWFFNSEHFGHHQHIDFLSYYATTGQKLPIDTYNFDPIYLEKKYLEILKSKEKNIIKDGYSLVSQWYHCTLFLVCKELNLSTKNFKISIIDNREYNPLTKSSRQLRGLTPFRINECDIKSAFPTFMDIECKSNLKDSVYENLMLSRNITRADAKVLFNKYCNSGAYHSIEETTAFLIECGYTAKECSLITELTHNRDRKFISFMTEYESFAIDTFILKNGLQRSSRLHDSVIFIDNHVKPVLLKLEPNCDFGYTELNTSVISNSFSTSKKRLPYAYINSIPQGLNLTYQYEQQKTDILGQANGFRIYEAPYKYITGSFNLNQYFTEFDDFLTKCKAMFSVILYLQDDILHYYQIDLILKHIRENSNIVFNVRALCQQLLDFKCDKSLITVKRRDYKFTEKQSFREKIDFLNALSKARGIITTKANFYNIFCLFQERIENNDYGFMDEITFLGRKANNKLSFAILKMFNILTSGRERKGRVDFNSYPLYTIPIKGVTIKSMSLKPKQQNAFTKKMIGKYERELIYFNKLIQNRKVVEQLFIIVCDITDEFNKFKFERDEILIKKIKSDLLLLVENGLDANIEQDAKDFDKRYIININDIPLNWDLDNAFGTDVNNSIFNNISIEDANSRGEVFFNEYLNFHGYKKAATAAQPLYRSKEKYVYPELDFDAF